jgi:hypothetical protein
MALNPQEKASHIIAALKPLVYFGERVVKDNTDAAACACDHR